MMRALVDLSTSSRGGDRALPGNIGGGGDTANNDGRRATSGAGL